MTGPHPQTWLEVRPEGLYCRPGGFFVDPLRPVATAVVSHGHSDHARAGHDRVLATAETLAIMAARLGEGAARRQQALAYGETVAMGDTTVWLAPAGHVLGSAQIVIEHQGCRAVYSGDYKRQPDPTCAAFTAGPLRPVHHRGHLRPARSSATPSPRPRSPASCTRSPPSPSAATSSAPTPSARRSA